MHLSKRAQIAHLKTDKAFTKVSSKYADFVDIFLLKLAIELLKYIQINDYAIELIINWQSPYSPIYSLGQVELEILKTYIKDNLVNSFIKLSKFFARVLIFFNKKPDRSLRLCIDYWSLNNLTIKNWYLLLLIQESLDWLNRAL